MKKLLLAILTGFAALTLGACGSSKDKFGFIFLHDEKSTYDKNFIDAAKDVCEELGVQAVLKTNVAEGEACYSAAKELAKKGCKGVFADSFGHEPFMIQAAKEFPKVEFAHATGTKAHYMGEGVDTLTNFHNAFAAIYEGRYTAGIAAGMKLNEMIAAGDIEAEQAIMGYVGAFPYAEVVSGYTSFYLGAKSVCPSVTMKVRYTNSWYDENAESTTAKTLIEQDNCVLISQHADSQGAPSVCESKKVPNVFYNGENTSLTNSYLTSSRINWRPYFKYFINCVLKGEKMDADWTGTIANGAVEVFAASGIATEGTQAAMDAAIAAFKAGTLNVFDCSKFTVSVFGDGVKDFTNLNATVDADGHVTSYKADVDDAGDYVGETEVVSGGIFKESFYRSAPYFDIRIDGITEITA